MFTMRLRFIFPPFPRRLWVVGLLSLVVPVGLAGCSEADGSDGGAKDGVDSGTGDTSSEGVDSGIGGASTCIRAGGPFHVPPVLAGTAANGKMNFDLVMQRGTTEFVCDKPTDTMGYNGSFLGPTLIMNRGEVVVIDVKNEIGMNTTTHWHGFHVPAAMDGGPHQVIPPGTTWSPTFTVLNRASTYWYHPHLHPHDGIRDPSGTSGQVFRGLAGLIIVRDDESTQLALPQEYGVDDLPVIIQDRSFNPDGSFLEFPIRRPVPAAPGGGPPGGFEFPVRKGDKFLVNGVVSPVLKTHAQMIRFRVLNASNLRTYNLGFSDNRTFHQVSSDGGLLEAPVPLTRLVVAVAERMDTPQK